MAYEQRLTAILVADMENSEIQACAAVLSDLGYQSRIVADADKLLSEGDKLAIDLLLLDVDRLDTVLIDEIQRTLADEVPVLALIGQQQYGRFDDYLDQGFDDFIVKPIHTAWLGKKIGVFKQSRQLQLSHQEKCRKLSDYRQQLLQEQAVVVSLYGNILRANNLDVSALRSTISAKSIVNGDILLVGRTPDNHLHILLGHFIGCTISAAIAATPAAEIFFGMSAKGFQVTEIAEEINHKLYKLLSGGIFMTAVIAALRPDTKTLRVLNCGFPEQILLKRGRHNSVKFLPANNSPLGLQSKIELTSHNNDISDKDILYLYSKAALDAKNSLGGTFGGKALADCLIESGYGELQRRLRQHCGCAGEETEIALLELVCDVENVPWKSKSGDQQYRRLEALSWKTMMEFDVVTLRSLNPVPIIVNALMEIQGLQQHRQTIFMIVTELFANALDHGVLKLDSSIKSSPEGFMRFYELREERLQTYRHGYVRLLFEHKPTETGGQLRIKVIDSGDGFDFRAPTSGFENTMGFAGRGISLLMSLCSSVTYQGKGNRVTAVFDWEL